MLCVALAVLGCVIGPRAPAAEAKRATTLTVIIEARSAGPVRDASLAPGVYAIYGKGHELRGSGPVKLDRPFTIVVRPGDRLTFAIRLGPKADVFVRPRDDGIELFNAKGRPATGDVTARLALFNADGEPLPETQLAAYPPVARFMRVTIH